MFVNSLASRMRCFGLRLPGPANHQHLTSRDLSRLAQELVLVVWSGGLEEREKAWWRARAQEFLGIY